MSNPEYKLGKYIKKFYVGDNDRSIYLNKIAEYYNQVGGLEEISNMPFQIMDDIPEALDSLINGEYSLKTDTDIVKSQYFAESSCSSDFFGNPDDNSVINLLDMKILCVSRNIANARNQEFIYLFKKDFSLALTDLYMANGLTSKELSVSTNYIYSILDYSLKIFIEKLVKHSVLGEKTPHIKGNISLLYKGGNTTRLIMSSFYETLVNLKLQNNIGDSSPKFDISINKLKELIDTSSIGDWDYMIKIDWLTLSKYFHEEYLDGLGKLIFAYFYYISSTIKTTIKQMMMSSININNMARAVQSKFFSEEYREKIENFVNNYNNNMSANIESMKLDDIIIFDKKIEESSITDVTDKDMERLNKKSYYLQNFIDSISDPKFQNIDEFTSAKSRYIETNNIFHSVNGIQIINDLKTDNVYIALSESMLFLRNNYISSFDLIRIKMNNVFEFSLINNDQIDDKTLKANIELVDLSFTSRYDTKSIAGLQFDYPNTKSYIYFKIDKFANGIQYKIPSPQYMFGDICGMLFIENNFVWEDKKYAKRIKRLINLSLVCMYDDGAKTREINNTYKKYHKLFTDLANISGIKEKLKLLVNEYSIKDYEYNDVIRKRISKNVTEKFMQLDMKTRLVKINKNSNYYAKYLEFILASYIRTLIICNYILNNEVYGCDPVYIQDQLQVNRIIELDNVYTYINPNVVFTASPNLESIYENIRGTSHNLKSNMLLPLGPLANVPDPVETKFIEFYEILGQYERTLIELFNNCVIICDGIENVDIDTIKINYGGQSLY